MYSYNGLEAEGNRWPFGKEYIYLDEEVLKGAYAAKALLVIILAVEEIIFY